MQAEAEPSRQVKLSLVTINDQLKLWLPLSFCESDSRTAAFLAVILGSAYMPVHSHSCLLLARCSSFQSLTGKMSVSSSSSSL